MVIERWIHKIRKSAKYVILLGHVRINRETNNANGKIASTSHLDMNNGNRKVISKYVDGLATLRRKKDEAYISFKTAATDDAAKCRYDYLEGRDILISRKNDDGTFETFWGEIYPDYKNEENK